MYPFLMHLCLHPRTAMDIGALAAGWKGIEESQEVSVLVNDMPTADQEAVRAKLAAHDVVFVTKRDMPGAHLPRIILLPNLPLSDLM